MMARRRRVVRAIGEAPPELGDPDHELWRDPEAVDQFAEAEGVEYRRPSFSGPADPAWQMLKAFRQAWAERNGFVDDHRMLDLAGLREAGVYAAFRGPRYGWSAAGEIVPLRQ